MAKQLNRPVPVSGTVIACTGADCAFVNSNTPYIRIEHNRETGKWRLSASERSGYIVYITEPTKIVLDRIRQVRITTVRSTSAEAEVI